MLFRSLGRLLRDPSPITDVLVKGRTTIADVIRSEVLGRFVFNAIEWVERAQRDSANGLISDDRIAKAVQNVAQYMSNPNKTHWNAVKRIFQYLKSTRDYVLTVGGDGPREPEAWCDASHADQPKVKSTSGYAIFIGQGCIAWSAKKQTIVALSTTEAEFYAAEHCGREIIWLRQLFQEIGLMPVRKPAPTLHHMDSSTAIKKLTTPDEVNNRTKHVDIAYY